MGKIEDILIKDIFMAAVLEVPKSPQDSMNFSGNY